MQKISTRPRAALNVTSILVVTALLLTWGATTLSAQTARVGGQVSIAEGDLPAGLVVRFEPLDEAANSPVEMEANKKGRFSNSRCPGGAFSPRVEPADYVITKLEFIGRAPDGRKVAEFSEVIESGEAVPSFQILSGMRAEINIEIMKIDANLTGGLSIEEVKDDSPKLIRLNEIFQQGDWSALVSEAETVLAESPELGGAHYLHAVGLWKAGRLGEAATTMERALEFAPDQPGIHETFGALLVEQGQVLRADGKNDDAAPVFTHAVEQLDLGLAKNPGSIPALNNKVIALEGVGRYDDAVLAIDALLAQDPSLTRAYMRKAELLVDGGRPDEALAVIANIPDTDKHAAEVIYNAAVEIYNRGNMEATIAAVDRALAIDPSLPLLYRLKGRSLVALGRDADGIAQLRKYLSMVPEDDPEAGPDRALVEALGGG